METAALYHSFEREEHLQNGMNTQAWCALRRFRAIQVLCGRPWGTYVAHLSSFCIANDFALR